MEELKKQTEEQIEAKTSEVRRLKREGEVQKAFNAYTQLVALKQQRNNINNFNKMKY